MGSDITQARGSGPAARSGVPAQLVGAGPVAHDVHVRPGQQPLLDDQEQHRHRHQRSTAPAAAAPGRAASGRRVAEVVPPPARARTGSPPPPPPPRSTAARSPAPAGSTGGSTAGSASNAPGTRPRSPAPTSTLQTSTAGPSRGPPTSSTQRSAARSTCDVDVDRRRAQIDGRRAVQPAQLSSVRKPRVTSCAPGCSGSVTLLAVGHRRLLPAGDLQRLQHGALGQAQCVLAAPAGAQRPGSGSPRSNGRRGAAASGWRRW